MCSLAYCRALNRSPAEAPQAVIAEPNQTAIDQAQLTPQPANEADGACPLSQQELYQLTLYKWRYSLEAFGFDRQQVRDLMFLKWLHASRRVQP
jgi:hypothetical protein